MTSEEIVKLGELSRVKLSDEEAQLFGSEISAILGYVTTINEIVADTGVTKQVGPVHNVFREDVVTNEPGLYTNTLVAAFPEASNNLLKVKKILNPDN